MDTHKKSDVKADLNKAAENIRDATNEVKKQAQDYSDEIVNYIKEYPVKSVLIASAVGLLLGKFIL